MKRIIVVGGGITGLAAAHRAVELSRERGLPIDVQLFEAGDRLGGNIFTHQRDGFLIEAGPDAFITNKPWALDLCRRLGIAGQLVQTNPSCRRTFVVRRGVLHPVPEGFLLLAPTRIWPFITSRLFSWPGKLRMAMDMFLPARRHGSDGDESLGDFVRRRFGREALERVAQPLVGGIYTADPNTLSLRATMPRFLDMESAHGSIIRAMRREQKQRAAGFWNLWHRRPTGASSAETAVPQAPADSGARYSLFVSFDRGMSTLVDALESRLPAGSVHRRSPVARIRREGQSWRVELADGPEMTADAVVLATPAYVSSELLSGLDPDLSADLAAIRYASSATMTLAYRRDQIRHALDGFGFVVPAAECRSLIAVTFSSVKFPKRSPEGWVLMRAFLGGAMHGQVYDLPDDALIAAVQRDLRDLIGVQESPAFIELHRWSRSMPQYPVGHLDHVRRIMARLTRWPGLRLAGNAFGGVGIPDCVHSGEVAIESLLSATDRGERT